ncbi:MAG: NAD-dependent epimerase/dehydratase family protein [Alicyclobacillus sp.]|nr:NAD-dependent epimerase/dehydratase family protein [Alicyclobacillus sp.]
MKLLILGGTKFLGRFLAEEALRRGHAVTLFHRGRTNPGLFPEAEEILGDRDGGVDALAGGAWDAVMDTSGYLPRVVAQSVERLRTAVPRYAFISSISVYPDFPYDGLDETYRVDSLPPEDADSEDVGRYYGALKARCEQVVQAAYGDGALVIRPGLIVGPHDPTDRFTYWPHRFAAGGEVLVPGRPERPVQFIDVRDLAAWTLDMVEAGEAGVYNATGPVPPVTMGTLVAACVEAAAARGVTAEPVWVDGGFLKEQAVGEWVEMPLWISEAAGWPGFMTVSVDRAVAKGLRFRPVMETVEDTLAWDAARPPEPLRAGMARDKEQAVLAAWTRSTGRRTRS